MFQTQELSGNPRNNGGYPDSQNTLGMWVKEYRKTGTVKSARPDYSEEEMDFACECFEECGSISQTVKDLGYPDSRMTLCRWLSGIQSYSLC